MNECPCVDYISFKAAVLHYVFGSLAVCPHDSSRVKAGFYLSKALHHTVCVFVVSIILTCCDGKHSSEEKCNLINLNIE